MTVEKVGNSAGALLSVFAKLILDNVSHLDETVGRVTDLVMNNGRPDREMIVTLQGFDRLKQEFEALSNALSHYAKTTNVTPLNEDCIQFEQKVIAAITVADLKVRIVHSLHAYLPENVVPPVSEVVVAGGDVDVDVVF